MADEKITPIAFPLDQYFQQNPAAVQVDPNVPVNINFTERKNKVFLPEGGYLQVTDSRDYEGFGKVDAIYVNGQGHTTGKGMQYSYARAEDGDGEFQSISVYNGSDRYEFHNSGGQVEYGKFTNKKDAKGVTYDSTSNLHATASEFLQGMKAIGGDLVEPWANSIQNTMPAAPALEKNYTAARAKPSRHGQILHIVTDGEYTVVSDLAHPKVADLYHKNEHVAGQAHTEELAGLPVTAKTMIGGNSDISGLAHLKSILPANLLEGIHATGTTAIIDEVGGSNAHLLQHALKLDSLKK